MRNLVKSENERLIEAIDTIILNNQVKNYAEFCRRLNISTSTIRDIRLNKRGATNKMMGDMLTLFGINPIWIINGTSNMYTSEGNTVKIPVNTPLNTPVKGNIWQKEALNEQKTPFKQSNYVQNETPQNSIVAEEHSLYNVAPKREEELLQRILSMANEINGLNNLVEALKSQIESLKLVEKLRNINEELQKKLTSAQKSA